MPPLRPAELLLTLADVFFDQVRVDEHGPHVALLRQQCLDPAPWDSLRHRPCDGYGRRFAGQLGRILMARATWAASRVRDAMSSSVNTWTRWVCTAPPRDVQPPATNSSES